MTQFLDKEGLQRYTTKIKEYIANHAGGITKDVADATYASKTTLASSSTNGLMSSSDKDAIDSIITSTNVGSYTMYMIDDQAITPEVFSIVKFDGFVNVDESKISISGASTTTKNYYNNTTNTFISGTTTATPTYHTVVDRSFGTTEDNKKGAVPFINHIYIDSTDNTMYIYNGTSLAQISPYVIPSSDIDSMLE